MRRLLLTGLWALPVLAQAPLLQDSGAVLRQVRLDWTVGEAPLPASSLPFLEAGLGGADGEGVRAPVIGGEGLGTGTQGWGIGLRGRATREGWSLEATFLGLRDHGHTVGVFQRGGITFQAESGWRMALEQTPLVWGTGFLGGDLLGPEARPFPHLGLTTSTLAIGPTRWQAEAFAGRLVGNRPIPTWMPDRQARLAAQEAGLDLNRPDLLGAKVHLQVGPLVEATLGALSLQGGVDGQGQPAPSGSARTLSLAEVRVRIPAFARLLEARGVSLLIGRGGAPDSSALALNPGRTFSSLQSVWSEWDLGFEYAGPSPRPGLNPQELSHLAGFSSQGDPLGPAFGPTVATRTLELGLPLPLEGRGLLRLVRATAPQDHSEGNGTWFLQGDLQLRTPTGRAGLALASRRAEFPSAPSRWGWSLAVFHAFRVF